MKRIEHGTVNGYRMHHHRGHRGIEICDDCHAAAAWDAAEEAWSGRRDEQVHDG